MESYLGYIIEGLVTVVCTILILIQALTCALTNGNHIEIPRI